MTYQELINEIRDLGYGEDEEIMDFGDKVYTAINRAINEINVKTYPIMDKYEFEITDEDTGYLYLDMSELGDGFIDFADVPVLYEQDGTQYFQHFNDYEIEMLDTVVINADRNKGKFRIYYKRQHERINASSNLNTDIELPLKVQHLISLLAAYYLWEEDEPTRATQLYNMYEQERDELLGASNKPRLRIIEGGI